MKYVAKPVKVDAHVITAVAAEFDDTGYLRIELDNDHDVLLPPGFTARYTPVKGDYYVVQDGGYAYLNPKEVFERKYAPCGPGRPENADITKLRRFVRERQRVADYVDAICEYTEADIPEDALELFLPEHAQALAKFAMEGQSIHPFIPKLTHAFVVVSGIEEEYQ